MPLLFVRGGRIPSCDVLDSLAGDCLLFIGERNKGRVLQVKSYDVRMEFYEDDRILLHLYILAR